ncbi:aldehyde dehydrogenase family protein [Gordonia sp. SID5947]|uniref:aldehyde dehydrogenase family protein n=1 Tax=Gordonia sp. SID5947 TaxID=2690315 RepID=UPI001371353C|nr:aldehyde dehydrogenase family protein [Gordonia sp. SID5947]MYR06731.1 aldehyde dehydrogenase family protein [Gordonia sp. SID5947]
MTIGTESLPADVLPTGLLIGGDRVNHSSAGSHEHIYPATGKPNATVTLAGFDEVDRAVAAAREAQREWMSLTTGRRRDILFDLADAVHAELDILGRLSVHDFAVPIRTAPGHAMLAESFIRYYAGHVDKAHGENSPVSGRHDLNIIDREPYGVVGVIAPWNGPMVVVGLNVAPALAAGNAVILKPSEMSPFSALRFGEICLEAGLPPGLVNVLPADADGGHALVSHPGIGKIHFTGGGTTARKVLATAAANLTPVATELGGKSANIIFADADLEQAAILAAWQGPLGQSGQSCACGSRILVQQSVYDEFMQRFLAVLDAAPMGDPFDPAVMVGPVISESALHRILGVIDDAVDSRHGVLTTGGHRAGGELGTGYYIEPTVFADVDNRSPLATEETFGPVVSVMRFHEDDDAIAIANDTEFGLNAYVATANLKRAHRLSRALESGSVWINRNSDISPQGPYGGFKKSGTGRSGGIEGLHEFQQVKNTRIGL